MDLQADVNGVNTLYIYSKSMKTQHLYFRYPSNMDLSIKIFGSIRQLYFTFSIKRLGFVLIDCHYALFNSTCSETNNLIPCNVPHEWFVLLHCVLSADWVDNIFPTSKFRYVFSISNYSKIKSLKIANNFRAGGSGSCKVVIRPVYERLLHFGCSKHWYKNQWWNDAYNRNTNLATMSITS